MDTLQVFALNIQPSQIKVLLPISDQKSENIEKERNQFLNWLRDMYKGGARFFDQFSAWQTYLIYIQFDLFDEIEEETIWQTEEEILESKIQPKNYSESGGQQ